MKTIIRLTESDLHRLVSNAVKRALREGDAFGKYEKDLGNIELNRVQDDMGMAYAYSHMNDPIIKKVKGSTIGDVLSQDGTGIGTDTENYEDVSQDFITNEFLNTPDAAHNYNKFPRYSRKGGVKNYNNLNGGSDRIRQYKQMKGAV